MSNILRGIDQDEPGHAPLFYFLELLFCQLIASTPFAMRLVSAIFSALTLPVIFWLAFETYNSRLIAALTMAFAALSPSLIFYAQEARDYSMGMFCMFLSSALLLNALRTSRTSSYVGYAMTLLVGFYSWLFTLLVFGAQLLYVLVTQGLRSKVWPIFAFSCCLPLLGFSPWLLFLYKNTQGLKQAYSWIKPSVPFTALFNCWLTMPCKAFALLGVRTGSFEMLLLVVTLFELAAFVLAARAVRSPKWLQLCIIAVWFLAFGAQDLVFGGARSAPFRYQTMAIGSTLILFPVLIQWLWQRGQIARFMAVAMVLLLFALETFSSSYFLSETTWPNKSIKMRYTYPMAVFLNWKKEPLILCEQKRINLVEALDLSWVLKPDARLIFRTSEHPQSVPNGTSTVYLWNSSGELERELTDFGFVIDEVEGLPYLKTAVRKNEEKP